MANPQEVKVVSLPPNDSKERVAFDLMKFVISYEQSPDRESVFKLYAECLNVVKGLVPSHNRR